MRVGHTLWIIPDFIHTRTCNCIQPFTNTIAPWALSIFCQQTDIKFLTDISHFTGREFSAIITKNLLRRSKNGNPSHKYPFLNCWRKLIFYYNCCTISGCQVNQHLKIHIFIGFQIHGDCFIKLRCHRQWHNRLRNWLSKFTAVNTWFCYINYILHFLAFHYYNQNFLSKIWVC